MGFILWLDVRIIFGFRGYFEDDVIGVIIFSVFYSSMSLIFVFRGCFIFFSIVEGKFFFKICLGVVFF